MVSSIKWNQCTTPDLSDSKHRKFPDRLSTKVALCRQCNFLGTQPVGSRSKHLYFAVVALANDETDENNEHLSLPLRRCRLWASSLPLQQPRGVQ